MRELRSSERYTVSLGSRYLLLQATLKEASVQWWFTIQQMWSNLSVCSVSHSTILMPPRDTKASAAEPANSHGRKLNQQRNKSAFARGERITPQRRSVLINTPTPTYTHKHTYTHTHKHNSFIILVSKPNSPKPSVDIISMSSYLVAWMMPCGRLRVNGRMSLKSWHRRQDTKLEQEATGNISLSNVVSMFLCF